MKKYLLIFITTCFLFHFSLFAREWHDVKIISYSNNRVILKYNEMYHKLAPRLNKSSEQVIVDTIYYYNPPISPDVYDEYLAGYQGTGSDPADTCINWFSLLAPGTVTKIMMQNVSSGTANFNMFAPAIDWDEGRYVFPDDPESNSLLPYSVPFFCEAKNPDEQFTNGEWTPIWNVFDIKANFGSGIYLEGDSLDFWVGYSLDKTGNPKIWQDGYYHDSDFEGACRSFSTLHAFCPNNYGCWYSIVNANDNNLWLSHIMQIEVEYEHLPPIISDVSRFSDTFASQKKVKAKIVEIEGETFTAELVYKTGINGQYQSVTMKDVGNNNFEATLNIEEGDTVYYYVEATDESDYTGYSNIMSIVNVVPPENAPLLVVNNNGGETYWEFLRGIVNIGQAYFFWDMNQHNGIDSTVINYSGFKALMVFGWGTDIIPITDVETQDVYGIKKFLDNGGSLLLSDMDYLFAWGLEGQEYFQQGDFAYDYLGIDRYESDPDDDNNVENGGSADNRMKGVNDDVISGDFSGSNYYGPIDYEMPDPDWANWGDFIVANSEAFDIFHGVSSNKSMAVRKEGENFKTVTFAFPIHLCSDPEKYSTLLYNTLLWFGAYQQDIDNEYRNVKDYKLNQNHPNPFNPSTKISYYIPSNSHVLLNVYDINGRLVRNLVNSYKESGCYIVVWNGKDNMDKPMSSGVYIYTMKIGNNVYSRKMLLIR
ncbi:MAG: T9SS type A sorting domain-containing protein [Candidatus Marinimicrobia bacterium]|nr:T9SS type A sorting domain-containing protein [Candidatus Neomarinimicrobiota bacterium]